MELMDAEPLIANGRRRSRSGPLGSALHGIRVRAPGADRRARRLPVAGRAGQAILALVGATGSGKTT